MQRSSGLDVSLLTAKRSPRTRMSSLSEHSEKRSVVDAFREGAAAYVLNDAGAAEMVWAIHEVIGAPQNHGTELSDPGAVSGRALTGITGG